MATITTEKDDKSSLRHYLCLRKRNWQWEILGLTNSIIWEQTICSRTFDTVHSSLKLETDDLLADLGKGTILCTFHSCRSSPDSTLTLKRWASGSQRAMAQPFKTAWCKPLGPWALWMSNQFSTLKTSELVISIELSCSEGIARELIGGRTNSLRVKNRIEVSIKKVGLDRWISNRFIIMESRIATILLRCKSLNI